MYYGEDDAESAEEIAPLVGIHEETPSMCRRTYTTFIGRWKAVVGWREMSTFKKAIYLLLSPTKFILKATIPAAEAEDYSRYSNAVLVDSSISGFMRF